MIDFFIKKNKGFTLIELLVVISVVSLLSSIVLSSLNSARSKARDTKRKQDLIQLRTALEAYYADNGVYPLPLSGYTGGNPTGGIYSTCLSGASGATASGANAYIQGLVPSYISVLPAETVSPTASQASSCYGFLYETNSTRANYKDFIFFSPESFPTGWPTDPARSGSSNNTLGNYVWAICSDTAYCAST